MSDWATLVVLLAGWAGLSGLRARLRAVEAERAYWAQVETRPALYDWAQEGDL